MRNFFINQTVINLGATSVCILGLSVMIGWYLHLPALIQIHAGLVPMQFNTALGFVVIGLAVMGLNYDRTLTIGLGITAILLGALTLIQYIFQVDFHIDELFIKHYITTATSHPGRMAPNTALNFLLSGISLLLLSQPNAKRNLVYSSFLGALIVSLGSVACLGYLSHIETAYGWGKLTRMALHTSSGFIVVGLILILQSQYIGLKVHQKLSASLLPITLLLFGFTMTIALWQALYSTELSDLRQSRLALTHPIAMGLLVLGCSLSIVLAIAVWFAIRYREQVQALEVAQQRILTLNQKLEQLSYLDGLTGIANRRFFDLTFEKEWHRAFRYQYPIALMMIDIDFFKKYNDYYGHQKGDECIQKIAHLIETMARRKTDIAARYGGEEFILLLANIDVIDAKKIAYNLIKQVAEAKISHKNSLVDRYITVSIGLHVEVPTENADMEHFILQADKALYQSKNTGRGRVVLSEFRL